MLAKRPLRGISQKTNARLMEEIQRTPFLPHQKAIAESQSQLRKRKLIMCCKTHSAIIELP